MITSPHSSCLPTCVFGSWTVAAFRDSVLSELQNDTHTSSLRMFFYAITSRGWIEIREALSQWRISCPGRSVVVYVGTDHAVTEPAALEAMQLDGISVRLMQTYQGVFHPKVVWLAGTKRNLIWVGSNNLTRDGLLNNIEFAVAIRSEAVPDELARWCKAVDEGSTLLTQNLLLSYQDERQTFESQRANANSTTFTWSGKGEPVSAKTPDVRSGDLIVEIMPRETGPDGTQIQLPKKAVNEFFGLTGVGATKTISLLSKGTKESRDVTMTVFRNNTVRLSISELEYRDRPCVIVFRNNAKGQVIFEIVAQNIFPTRYRALLARCTRQTREGSRRWIIV
jgi:hypothetical protein